jgi:hypothetical protein
MIGLVAVSKQKQRKIKLLRHRLSQKQSKLGQFKLLCAELRWLLKAPSSKLFSLSDHFFSIAIQGRNDAKYSEMTVIFYLTSDRIPPWFF